MRKTSFVTGLVLTASAAAASAAPTVAQLRKDHRLLLVSAPAGSTELAAQRQALARWQPQGAERDVVTVYLDGAKVEGASDSAASIRSRYAIPTTGFAVALVGKDGHVAYRSSKLVSGDEFEKTIDAMPMRRAGQR